MKTLISFWITVIAFVAGGHATPAHASCNAVPSALTAGGVIPQGLPFRGAVGRVDLAYVAAGLTSSLVLAPDAFCARADMDLARLRFRDSDGDETVSPDDLIVSLYFGMEREKGIPVRRYASKKECDSLNSIRAMGPPLFDPVACDNTGVEIIPRSDGDRVRIPYPDTTALRLLANEVTVVVMQAGDTGRSALSNIEKSLAGGELLCADIREAVTADGYVCIDKLYEDWPLKHRCSVRPEMISDFSSALMTLPMNDFGRQCTDDSGEQICEEDPSQLVWARDKENGKMSAAFNWLGVLATNGQRRIVTGSTATARSKPGDNPRMLIPGREFLSSTDIANGGDPTKPTVLPYYETGLDKEFGMIGTVDQPNSALHIRSREMVRKICKSPFAPDGEGCYALETDAQGYGEVVDCCGHDRPTFGCSCEPVAARYYACRGGKSAGMPCTRPEHCGVSGVCDGQPSCQKTGESWKTGKGLSKNAKCWADDKCKADHPSKPQCGYALFDFKERLDNAGDPQDRAVTLKWKIKGADPLKKRRGVCAKDRDTVCNAKSGCSAGAGDCIGYGLRALGIAP